MSFKTNSGNFYTKKNFQQKVVKRAARCPIWAPDAQFWDGGRSRSQSEIVNAVHNFVNAVHNFCERRSQNTYKFFNEKKIQDSSFSRIIICRY
jgi:hypothetical protein